MKISYSWLQTYFEETLPNPQELAEALTFHAYEVEGVEEVKTPDGADYVLDVDVLPNRASDSLCHRGVAHEISRITGAALKERTWVAPEENNKNTIAVHVEEPALCKRYIAQILEGVSVGPSPQWLENRLTSIGERSINGIVDATNFVLFDMGQPLHAFDLDKIEGGEIHVRMARAGETLTTLDGTEVTFDGSELVIADSKDPIAIAGVKGGRKAEIDENTTRIVLEAAHFHPVTVRKTARKLGILTSASKRFENGITMHWASEGVAQVIALISDLPECEKVQVAESTDVYRKLPKEYKTGVSVERINKTLGTQLLSEDVAHLLGRLEFLFEKSDKPVEDVITEAQKHIGAEYTYGASVMFDAPEQFDCSSFLVYVFSRAGVTIPRQAIDQYVFGEPIEENELQPGDIVFSRNETVNTHSFSLIDDGSEVTHTGPKEYSELFLPGTRVEGGVSHNGLYIGDGMVIHAHPQKGIVSESLQESEKFAHIVGFRRIAEAQSERFVVSVPKERLDVRTSADLVEEVGRIYGYRNIETQMPKEKLETHINKRLYYMSVVRNVLTDFGFSEVYTYVFQKKGQIELANPLAQDRAFLRTDLRSGLEEALDMNEKHAPLLDGTDVRIFEIGKVFTTEKEKNMLAIGVRITSGKKKEARAEEEVKNALQSLSESLGAQVSGEVKEGIAEIDFDAIIEQLPDPSDTNYTGVLPKGGSAKFTPISPYPFVLRDVAAWTPERTKQDEFAFLIKEHAGDLLAKEPECFDVFEKGGRVSYAFNLVFQSLERTLTDVEVNAVMDKIYEAIEVKGWEAR